MTEANARQGRRNKTAGDDWRDRCVRWLNDHGWPGAGYQLRNRSNDITGTWDLGIETTITAWDRIFKKLDQSCRDAKARGLADYCVWKKRRGTTDPGEGAVIMPAHRFFPLVMRLEELEQASLAADAQFARGWTAHVEYMRKHPGPVEEAV